MQGTVRKRGSKWYYRYLLGTTRIEKVGGKTKKEALEKLNDELYKLQNNIIVPPKTKLKDFLNLWIADYVMEDRAKSTVEKYKKTIELYIDPIIGDILLCDLKVFHIELFLKDMKKKGLSGTSRQTYFGTLRAALNKAVKLQMLNDNPCKFADIPKRDNFKANVLTVEEFHKIYNYLDINDFEDFMFRFALELTLETGLRRGELSGLCWDDIDFKNKSISINNNLVRIEGIYEMGSCKTANAYRTLPISDFLINRLEEIKLKQKIHKEDYSSHYVKNIWNKKEYDLIFRWANGSYIHPATFLQRLKRILGYIGIEKRIRWHDLRHTNATLLLEGGIDFKTLSTRLGHSMIQTTMDIYAHTTEKMNRNATNVIHDILKH
ncbi:tyrosine-type recombinase/integrase [uncultured Clostridium sp.]|uniref:tyrosine-type recombinase/integrase n=1 Tax=uncultured Clostridium sp. TaxID=59620 RepID=UPI002630EA95|nr:tyrosine-type recombinase/integrase [uncultured Clostridium sp.]